MRNQKNIAWAVGALAFTALSTDLSSHAQSYNIDIDSPTSPPEFGGGTPSSDFGAAAAQQGFWNSVTAVVGPVLLFDLNGNLTHAILSITQESVPVTTLSWGNANNTGNFALLLNDASQVGTTSSGGTRTYSFDGLESGAYAIYTYATPPMDSSGSLSVNVTNSAQGTLVSSGAMLSNTFTLGVTHVIHTVQSVSGNITIEVTDTAGSPAGFVNGFQFVAIPTPGALSALTLACVINRRRRRSSV